MLFCRLLIFLKIKAFVNYFRNSTRMSNSLDHDQARHLSGLIWVQTVCKGYQQTTLVGKVKTRTYLHFQVLCGNKSDLESERQVTKDEGSELAKKLNIPFIETSAKTGDKITEAFETLVRNTPRPGFGYKVNNGSYMNAHALFNSFNVLMEKSVMGGLPSIYDVFATHLTNSLVYI